jgi:hypothetical protein
MELENKLIIAVLTNEENFEEANQPVLILLEMMI